MEPVQAAGDTFFLLAINKQVHKFEGQELVPITVLHKNMFLFRLVEYSLPILIFGSASLII
ncbi:hypothetical protein [Paenibacillus illinoisensis]|uniref:hypothetical protein n=1 Tax=Paenibacillus illinoisensis TaxID=59845 RepID=UPI00301BC0DA